MNSIVFWDVDTQNDFVQSNGKLYVPGAEKLRSNWEYLTTLGSIKARLCGSVDAHTPDDPEFDEWPEHCVYGSPGQLKIPETITVPNLFVPNIGLPDHHLSEIVSFGSQILFEKQSISIIDNQNVKPFFNSIKPELIVVYGVVTEICVDNAVRFFAGDLGHKVIVVSDAIKELDIIKARECENNWSNLGVALRKTEEISSLF